MLVAGLGITLSLAGCRTAPILTPQVALPASADRSDAEVAIAIKEAGLRYGWEMVDKGPGQIEGTLRLRRHVAVVAIPYDANGYTIEYQDSEVLRYGNGKIHRNYNRWVNNLSKDIKQRLGYGN